MDQVKQLTAWLYFQSGMYYLLAEDTCVDLVYNNLMSSYRSLWDEAVKCERFLENNR